MFLRELLLTICWLLWCIFPRNGLISHDYPPMPGASSSSIRYTGEFRHGIDSKNRITTPSDWRSGEGDEFYVRVHSSGGHIVVMPPAQLEKMVENIELRPGITVARRQELIRLLSSGARRCNADKQGRMVLPEEFCTAAQLKAEVMLVGAFGQFEIWNTERWTAKQSAAQEDNLQELAGELGL